MAQLKGRPGPVPPKSEWGTKDNFRAFRRLKDVEGRRPRCQGWSRNRLSQGYRSEDAQCHNSARPGSKYCKRHGARIKKPLNITQELDAYARSLPSEVSKLYVEALTDPDLLSIKREAGVMQARLIEVMKRLDSNESAKAWTEVQQSEVVFRQALKEKDVAQMVNGLRTAHRMLREAINKADYTAWHELENLLHSRSKLVQMENMRLRDKDLVFTVEELVAIGAKINTGLFDIIGKAQLDPAKDHQMRIWITELFRAIFFAGEHGTPTEQEEANAQWAMSGERGCYICRHDFYRERNKDEEGRFTCTHCGMYWEPELNSTGGKKEVIDGDYSPIGDNTKLVLPVGGNDGEDERRLSVGGLSINGLLPSTPDTSNDASEDSSVEQSGNRGGGSGEGAISRTQTNSPELTKRTAKRRGSGNVRTKRRRPRPKRKTRKPRG